MFTGIVQGIAVINSISGNPELKTFQVQFPGSSLTGLQRGASIALNGACLTVTEFDSDSGTAHFDVMQETLDKTNLSGLTSGDSVNFERAARLGDEIGGHSMSGHVHTTVPLMRRVHSDDNCTLFFKTPQRFRRYLLSKGYVGLDGCSLTLGEVNDAEFCVHLIPETLNVTKFGDMEVGELVNLEIDPQTQAIVDTVERVLAERQMQTE